MKLIKTEDAAGHVLCHDITQIIKDVKKGPVFIKGHVVREEDIPVLLSAGKEYLYVWEKQPGMLHENDAAMMLYALCADKNMGPSDVREGKIEVRANVDGLFTVNTERLLQINTLGDMMIATRRTNTPVKAGMVLAGTRVIPLIIPEEKILKAKELAGNEPILSIRPFKRKKYAVITTGNEVCKGRISDAFTPMVRGKLAEFDTEEIGSAILPDDPARITESILEFIGKGAEMVVCTGGMSVDPDDRTPLAIRNTGADVVAYGAPVLPGAMFMLAYKEGIPVMGLPGCVMYSKRTIFDLILPRVMADVKIRAKDLYILGHGGLCLHCEPCVFPNCGFGK